MTDEPPPPPEPEKPDPRMAKPGWFAARWLRGKATGSGANKTNDPDAWDNAGEWLIAHGALPALAAITIAVLAIHFHIFFGETAGDDLTFHFAESARLTDCLRHGDLDFWNPSANAGYASAYYYQVLPQLASALPAALFGHHLFWFQLSIVLPLVLAPAAAYKGMRLLGATPWQSALGAFVIAFMNGESRWGAGNAGTFQVGLYTQTWALCAFPLALGYAVRWMSNAEKLAPAIAWGGVVGLCHPFAGVCLGLAVFAGWFAHAMGLAIVRVYRWIADPDRRTRAPGAPRIPRSVTGLLWFFLRKLAPRGTTSGAELSRGAILAGALLLTWLPVLLTILFVDTAGFGGFPHRVSDEVGPGFVTLAKWYASGSILDWLPKGIGFRLGILTWTLPVIAIFARGKFFRWLWAPAVLYALLLGMGPHMGKLGEDLFPAVRALGAMQTVLAMGIGAGAISVGAKAWGLAGKYSSAAYSARTGIAAIAAALGVLIAVPGARALGSRVRVLGDYPNNQREQLLRINEILAAQPPARKQAGPGAENHWWNLLPYVYDRVPALLQMGGGGLQASPNYDFLWTQRDYVKNAWIYDAPYLVFAIDKGEKMPVGDTLGKTEQYEVRKLPAPGLVSPVQVTGTLPPGYKTGQPGHTAALAWIKGDAPLKDEVLAYDGSGGGGDPPAGRTIRSWRQDSPGNDADIVAEVEVDKPTTFVFRESWHPRWRVYIDGDPATVRRVTPDFPAVDVPAGKHTLELRFERPWWALAVWLLWPGVALAAWLVTRRLSRREREPPQLPEARAMSDASRDV